MGENRIPDDIFKQAVVKAREIETSVFEKRCKDTEAHAFSEKYRERMQVLKMGEQGANDSKIVSYSVKKKGTKVKILLIAAIVMLLGVLTVTAEPVRDFITHIKEILFLDHTHILFEEMETEVDEANQKESFIIRKPSYIPEGYTIKEEIKDDEKYEYTIEYNNTDEEMITYQQKPLVYADKFIKEFEDLNKEDISWNGEQRYLFTDDNEYKILLYEKGSYMYMVEGMVQFEILENVIESRKIIMPEDTFPRKLKIVPNGYELFCEVNSYEEMELYQYMQLYQNSEGENLVYEQNFIEEMDGWSITADGEEAEDISICGEPAKVMTDGEEYHSIVYVRGEFVYMLGGYDDVDVLIECLEAVFE